jgi:hypothetical protein
MGCFTLTPVLLRNPVSGVEVRVYAAWDRCFPSLLAVMILSVG